MGKSFTSIPAETANWINSQKMFFVATAPLSREAHVNLSPKGLDTFRILDESTVAYLDLTGSGVETIAHVRENGRITLMFCAFEGPPKIVRLYGEGEVITAGHEEFDSLLKNFHHHDATRSVIRIRVNRVSHSCGFGVPLYHYTGERDQLNKWTTNKGVDGVKQYQKERNSVSIDGMPGLP